MEIERARLPHLHPADTNLELIEASPGANGERPSNFQKSEPIIDRTINELARCYASHLIPVTNMIHSKPRSMRSFSDAFKLRKD